MTKTPDIKQYLLGTFLVLSTLCLTTNSWAQQNRSWLPGYVEVLPEGFLTPPTDNCYLGVSDPTLSDSIALYQAINRALVFFSLSEGVGIKYMSDYYVKSIDNQDLIEKVITMARFSYKRKPLSFRIEKQFRSKFNETFVWVTFLEPEKGFRNPSVKFSGEFLFIENAKNTSHRSSRIKFTTSYKGNTRGYNSAFYMADADGRTHEIAAQIRRNKYQLSEGNVFRYKSTTQEDPGFEHYVSTSLRYSFWNALTENLMLDLVSFNYNNLKLKNLNDNFTDRVVELNREIVRGDISYAIKNILIKENKLYVKSSINNL